MDNNATISKAIELIESVYGAGRAQLISDLLKPVSECFEVSKGAEDMTETLFLVYRLTKIRNDIIDNINDDDIKDAADSLAGEFISVGDAIARVENKKRIDAALEYSADIVYFNYM
jgi:hypothetical protein